MKRSKSIILGALAVAATLGMVGCQDDQPTQDVRSCVDKNGQVVDDSYCTGQQQTANGQNPNNDHIIRDILLYHWLFGGNFNNTGGRVVVYGGGFRPAPSMIYVSPRSSTGMSIVSSGSSARYTSVTRGGFGSSFHGATGGGE